MRKEDQVRVLVSASEKEQLVQAATRAGLPVASWLRSVGLREAAQLSQPEGGRADRRGASTPRRS
jgi:hypothetical protein